MSALRHRRRTGGRPVHRTGPRPSGAGGMLAQAFMDYSMNGVVQERIGNRSLDGRAPYGLYPARSEGDGSDAGDRWISISVMDDDQWLGLRDAMGDPEWARDPGLRTRSGPAGAARRVDRHISDWTSTRDDYELMHLLQSHGVPAAPVLDSSRVHDDPHVQHRELNEPLDLYDDVGTFRYNRPFPTILRDSRCGFVNRRSRWAKTTNTSIAMSWATQTPRSRVCASVATLVWITTQRFRRSLKTSSSTLDGELTRRIRNESDSLTCRA